MNQPRLRILIVDDAGPVVVLCVNVLQALGYAVKGANRGETAVELLRKERFDLMVLDYKMPGMTGFDVYHQAKTLHPELAVVLVTGHGSPEVVTEANRLGIPVVENALPPTLLKVCSTRGGTGRVSCLSRRPARRWRLVPRWRCGGGSRAAIGR